MKTHFTFASLAALLTLVPALAVAQPTTLPVTVVFGQELRINLTDGRKVSGKFLGVTPEGIELVSGDPAKPNSTRIRIASADIRRMRERDSLSNGAGTGALIVGLFGALAGAAADGLDSAFGGTSNGSYFLAGIGIGLASGAAIGAGFDALRQKTLYEREATATSVAVRPIVSAAGKGVSVQVRW